MTSNISSFSDRREEANDAALQTSATHSESLQAALEYFDRGWMPIPIGYQQKNPTKPKWQDSKYQREQLATVFPVRSNVGVLLGEPSKNLIDIDFDCPEACDLAEYILPETDCIFGRKSNQKSHRLYYASQPIQTQKFLDPIQKTQSKTGTTKPDRAMIFEIRSTGTQTVFPGSVHPSGEKIVFQSNAEPTMISASELIPQAYKLAIAVLLLRNYPEDGSRQEFFLALSGTLLRAGWSQIETKNFILLLTKYKKDPEAQKRAQTVQYTEEALDQKKKVTGFKKLSEFLEPKVVAALKAWLKIADDSIGMTVLKKQEFDAKTLGEEMIGELHINRFAGEFWIYQKGVFKRDIEERILRKAIHQKLQHNWKPAYENAVIQWLQSEVDFEPFKQHGENNLINVKNGMLNIEKGELVPHDPSFRSIVQLPITYDPTISTCIAKDFALGVIPKFAENCYWEILGTIHDTINTYRKALFLLGPARSGKSTLVEANELCVDSQNVSHENPLTLSTDKFAAASLYGKLLNTDSELELTQAMLVGMFKKTTAQSDVITAQHKFGRPFTFKPYAKHIYAANDFVPVAGSDTAFHDRIVLIYCPYVHDVNIKYQAVHIVTEEYKSSWLNASLEGLKRLQINNGKFSITTELQTAHMQHRIATDSVISWLLENTIEDQNAGIIRSSLYSWYEFDNDTPGQRRGIVSKKNFFSRIEDNKDLLKWISATKYIYNAAGEKTAQDHVFIGRTWKQQRDGLIRKDSMDRWIK